MECAPFKFRLPAAVQVSGPSNVGKSWFVAKTLHYRSRMIEPPPQLIFYCYAVWQPELFAELQRSCDGQIFFFEGLAQLQRLRFEPSIAHVLVLDDLMNEVGNSEFGASLFTRLSHHGNILIFFVTQNIYAKAKYMTTINKNVKYNVVFRNKRFRHELATLARQSLGLRPAHVHRVMEMAAAENAFPYIVLDLQNDTPETRAIVTNVLPDSKHPQAYYYVDQ